MDTLMLKYDGHWIDEAFDATYLEEKGGVGGGSFKVLKSSRFATQVWNFNMDKAYYEGGVEVFVNGARVGAWLVENIEAVLVGSGEAVDVGYLVSGRGLKAALDRAILYPETTGGSWGSLISPGVIFPPPAGDVGDPVLYAQPFGDNKRRFYFGSSNGTYTYQYDAYSGAWDDYLTRTNPVRQKRQDATSQPWTGFPADWTTPLAYWVWDRTYKTWNGNNYPTDPLQAPAGFVYFTTAFELSGTDLKNFSLFLACDNAFVVYLDSQKVIETNREINPAVYGDWMNTYRYDFAIGPGEHTLGFRCSNLGNVAGLLVALYELNVVGGADNPTPYVTLMSGYNFDTAGADSNPGVTRGGAATHTGTWKCVGYPTNYPGWTPGSIWHYLFTEATAGLAPAPGSYTRNVASLLGIAGYYTTPHGNDMQHSWTVTQDSAGQAWDHDVEWNFDIGDEYLSILERMEEAVLESAIDPTTGRLMLYKSLGTDRSATIRFEPRTNLLSAQNSTSRARRKNSLLVLAGTNWSEADGGFTEDRREAFLDMSSDEMDSTFVPRIVSATLDNTKNTEESSDVSFIPVPGAVPWVDFFVGDFISAPATTGVMAKRRVMSLSVAMNGDTGAPVYGMELDTLSQEREYRLQRWLSRLAGQGSIDGKVLNTL